MQPRTATPRHLPPLAAAHQDPDLVRLSRGLFNAGLFMSSLLAFRSAGGVTIGDLLLLASTGTLLMSTVGRRVVDSTPKLHVAVALVLIAGVASAGRSLSEPSDLAVMLRLVFLVGILPWQARALLPDRQLLTRAAQWWVAGAAVCAAGTLLQARFGAGIIPGAAVTSSGRFSGLTQTVSDTGGITAVAIAFCLGGLTARATRSQRWFTMACLGLSGIGLLLSGSVSGLLAAACAGIFLLVRRGVSIRRLVAMAVVALVVLQVVGTIQHKTTGALTPWQRVEQATGFARYTSAQQGLDTSQSRLETDRAGIRGYLAHPLVGAGLDTASGVVDQRDQFQVHNMLIGAAYQGGTFLVMGLMLPIGMAMRRGWRTARSSALATQLYAALVATIVFALTAPSDYNRYFWIPVALVLASFDVARRATDQSAAVAAEVAAASAAPSGPVRQRVASVRPLAAAGQTL
ncbi:hypothetical protein acdb102_10680 [Acidothermaceae bacterium B102]|nr:hypothetical protein acdb102_10680 [Acidothermaceae bacterium B102]